MPQLRSSFRHRPGQSQRSATVRRVSPGLPSLGVLAFALTLAPLALAAAAQPAGEPPPYSPPANQPAPYEQGYDPQGYQQPGYQPQSEQAPAQAAVQQQPSGDGTDAAAGPTGGAYSYLRLVEGSAVLSQASSGASVAAQVNQPIVAGDSLTVPPRGRVEVVLADNNILRLDGGSHVAFSHIANSAGQLDAATELRLDEGYLQLVVTEGAIGQQMPSILTPNAGVYLQAYGTYRVTAGRGDFTAAAVRDGSAQVATAASSVTVRAGQEAVASGGGSRSADLNVHPAGAFDALEQWARRIDDETRLADAGHVDPSLSYQAAPLDRYGHWINYQDQSYWQPNDEDSGWSPYSEGRWDSTPAGATWVADEPWGWVPYHYGTWDYLPSNGWAWQPGAVFSPAWVYWYWGANYVGWCPVGLYTGFYGGAFAAFHFGNYGWAGGSWGLFSHWNFLPAGHFFSSDWRHWGVGAGAFGRRGFPGGELARGLITTSTRGLTPAVLRGGPGAGMRFLAGRGGMGAGRSLPDVSSFVGRQAHLSAQVARAVGSASAGRLAGTPFAPHTQGGAHAAGSLARSMSPGGPGHGSRGFAGSSPSTFGNRGGIGGGALAPGRSPAGGTRQVYPAHPAPAQPHNDRSSFSRSYGGSYGGAQTWQSHSPASEYRAAPGNQTSPFRQSEQHYQSADRYQAAQRYQSAPRYQSQSAPRYQPAQRYTSTPRYSSAPHAQSPRSSSAGHSPSHASSSQHGGGGRGGGGHHRS